MGSTLNCRVPADWMSDPSLCWFEWQSLVAGFAALAVGALTIWMVRHQVKQQDNLHQKNRSARFAVVKAKSPIAAVEVAHHARAYLDVALKLLPLVEGRSDQAFRYEGPQFPPKAEMILDGLVETTDDPLLIDQVAALFAEQQVMASRLLDVGRPSEHTLCIDDYVLQPIMMDAIAMNLLAFGRDGTDIKRLTWNDIEAGAKRLLKHEPARTRILDYIRGKTERGVPVPLALRRHNDR